MDRFVAVIVLSLMATGAEAAQDGGGGAGELDQCLQLLDRLDGQRITVVYRSTPLRDVVADLATRLPAPIRADWDALKGIGISSDRLVSFQAEALACSKVLTSLTLIIGDEFDRPVIEVFGGQVVLTAPADCAAMRLTAVYDVRDLLTDGNSTARLRESALSSSSGGEAAKPDDAGRAPEPGSPPAPASPAPPAPPASPGAGSRGNAAGGEPAPPALVPGAVPGAGADNRLPDVEPQTESAKFCRLLMDHADPDAWVNFGGLRALMSEREGELLVSAPATTHRRLREVLGQLRAANPTALNVEAAVIDLPRDVLTRLTRLHHSGAALALTIRAAPESAVLWQTRARVGIDETVAVDSHDGATSIRLSLKAGFDRVRGLLKIELDAGTIMGSDQRTLRTTATMRADQQAEVFELAPAPGAPGGGSESTTRVLILELRPTT